MKSKIMAHKCVGMSLIATIEENNTSMEQYL
jgi:hypothetical protein